jgi:hypothetical protein
MLAKPHVLKHERSEPLMHCRFLHYFYTKLKYKKFWKTQIFGLMQRISKYLPLNPKNNNIKSTLIPPLEKSSQKADHLTKAGTKIEHNDSLGCENTIFSRASTDS